MKLVNCTIIKLGESLNNPDLPNLEAYNLDNTINGIESYNKNINHGIVEISGVYQMSSINGTWGTYLIPIESNKLYVIENLELYITPLLVDEGIISTVVAGTGSVESYVNREETKRYTVYNNQECYINLDNDVQSEYIALTQKAFTQGNVTIKIYSKL